MYSTITRNRDTVRRIRQELEIYFPSISFDIRSKNNQIRISYTNGIPKMKVRNVVNLFERDYPTGRLKIDIERHMGATVKEKLLEETKLVWGIPDLKENSWLEPVNMLVFTYMQMIFNIQDYQ